MLLCFFLFLAKIGWKKKIDSAQAQLYHNKDWHNYFKATLRVLNITFIFIIGAKPLRKVKLFKKLANYTYDLSAGITLSIQFCMYNNCVSSKF